MVYCVVVTYSINLKMFLTKFVALLAYAAASTTLRIDYYKNIQAVSGRIAGGQDAQRHQFPYQASLEIIRGKSSTPRLHHCGGTLIAKRWVLTAAHCKRHNTEYKIVLGQLNRGQNHSDIQVFKAVQFITHEKFIIGSPEPTANDIAVIELDRDAELTDAVQIAQLANDEQCDDLSNSTASGWGFQTNHRPAITLQWVTVPRISNKQCADAFIRLTGSSEPLDDTMICIGVNSGNQQLGACSGDSGGPLVLEKKNVLTGVASWTYGFCGTIVAPSVFTRICSHREFINKHVKS